MKKDHATGRVDSIPFFHADVEAYNLKYSVFLGPQWGLKLKKVPGDLGTQMGTSVRVVDQGCSPRPAEKRVAPPRRN